MSIFKFAFSSNHLSKDEFVYRIELIKKKMYFIAKTKIDNIEDVEDVIQETIYKAYKNLNKLKDTNKFDAWVIQILLATCNDFYRNKKELYEIDENTVNENNEYSEFENKYDFLTLLKDLDEEEKIIMILYYSDSSTTNEIAQTLNLNENTVKTKIKRAKEKIKKSFERSDYV